MLLADDGYTHSFCTAANGDTNMLELLIARGFSIGSSALAYAAKHGNADMMKVRGSSRRGVDLLFSLEAA
jgi:hypothetical protein